MKFDEGNVIFNNIDINSCIHRYVHQNWTSFSRYIDVICQYKKKKKVSERDIIIPFFPDVNVTSLKFMKIMNLNDMKITS